MVNLAQQIEDKINHRISRSNIDQLVVINNFAPFFNNNAPGANFEELSSYQKLTWIRIFIRYNINNINHINNPNQIIIAFLNQALFNQLSKVTFLNEINRRNFQNENNHINDQILYFSMAYLLEETLNNDSALLKI